MCSRSPPRSRTYCNPPGRCLSSRTVSKPKAENASSVRLSISSSQLAILRMPALREPSASKMPARNPRRHSSVELLRPGDELRDPLEVTPPLRPDRGDRLAHLGLLR